jgi:hypothetical protein
MKVIKKKDFALLNNSEYEKAVSQLISEIKIQMFMEHPNLIKLYDFFADQRNIYLLLELGCDGQLYTVLQK